MFFVSFLHDFKTLAPAFAGAVSFYKKKFFSAFGGTSLFLLLYFLTPIKKNTMYFTDLSLVTHKKTFKYFLKKKLSIFFTCFLCNFYMTSKYWPRLLPGLCPFIKKFFPPSAGHPYFCYYTF